MKAILSSNNDICYSIIPSCLPTLCLYQFILYGEGILCLQGPNFLNILYNQTTFWIFVCWLHLLFVLLYISFNEVRLISWYILSCFILTSFDEFSLYTSSIWFKKLEGSDRVTPLFFFPWWEIFKPLAFLCNVVLISGTILVPFLWTFSLKSFCFFKCSSQTWKAHSSFGPI